MTQVSPDFPFDEEADEYYDEEDDDIEEGNQNSSNIKSKHTSYILIRDQNDRPTLTQSSIADILGKKQSTSNYNQSGAKDADDDSEYYDEEDDESSEKAENANIGQV
jgi:hypothetical protein